VKFFKKTPVEQCNFFFNDASGAMQFFLTTPAEQCNFKQHQQSNAIFSKFVPSNQCI